MVRRTLTLALVGAMLSFTTACSSQDDDAPEDSGSTASAALTVEDVWVKSAESGMSAAFGVLTNSSDEAVTVTSASSSASGMVELHETVEDADGQMVMRQKDGGFVVPANGTFVLEPGGNHLMLMNLNAPVKAGDEVNFTLTLSDGSTLDFTAPAKDYSGANEHYADGE